LGVCIVGSSMEVNLKQEHDKRVYIVIEMA
jgi:hypothetical protein